MKQLRALLVLIPISLLLVVGVSMITQAVAEDETVPQSLQQQAEPLNLAEEADISVTGMNYDTFSYVTDLGLRIGMQHGHFATYSLGYGFRWPDSSANEHLAIGWWGEGFTVGYAGGATIGYSYQSSPYYSGWSGVSYGSTAFPNREEYLWIGNVGDLKVTQNAIIFKAEKDVALDIVVENTGDSTISGIRYKRIVDWDVDRWPSSNWWDYFVLPDGAEFQTATSNTTHPWGYTQCAVAVPPCSEPPTLHDQSAWSDMYWSTYVDRLDDDCLYRMDGNALFEWRFDLEPGEKYHILLFYLVDGATDCRDHEKIIEDYEELLSKVCEIPVFVDIKPGSCPNPLNLKSKGGLPVAILGTEDIDVTTIDPATIRLSREGIEEGVSPLRWAYEDAATPFEGELCDCHDLNGDGYMDLTLKFDTQELVATLSLEAEAGNTIPLILTGNLKEEEGGTAIKGSDCVRIK